MKLSEAKALLREVKAAKDIEEVIKRYPSASQAGAYSFSPISNQFRAKRQQWDIEQMKVGDKDVLYLFRTDRANEYFNKYPKDKPHHVMPWNGYDKFYSVGTWTGRKIGKITNMSFYEGSGFAPVRRVSVTFLYGGMTFRGICSYESMDCFRVKRIK